LVIPAPPGAQLEGDEPETSSPLDPESVLLDSPSALLGPESVVFDPESVVFDPEPAPLLESWPLPPAESAAPPAPPPVASFVPESPFPWVSPPFDLGQPADMLTTSPSIPSRPSPPGCVRCPIIDYWHTQALATQESPGAQALPHEPQFR
jgi:hypothetical protein